MANRLIHASSPYLQQHAHNPVDWYEWGSEAFEKARQEDKLVLVSIGYSACHWCHVMERESFEHAETAALMNAHFVCIKVDREERPDVDQVYMDAVQLLTHHGGWPLNAFVLPDGRPIHGGTYFPREQWEQTLEALAGFYRSRRQEALDFAAKLTEGIRRLDFIPEGQPSAVFREAYVSDLFGKWKASFDKEHGGFNWAPKFPLPNTQAFFLQYHYHTGDTDAGNMVHTTLEKMARGGIYDQSGGGFARYSVDAYWKVPHFEKMLYDNAQLVSLYADAWRHSNRPLYRKVVYETLAFVQRELTHAEGGFFSALDADSEGVEGKFYTWTKEDLKQLLGRHEPLFSLYYNVQPYGNWEDGMNILFRTHGDEELEALTKTPIDTIESVIAECHHILLKARTNRVRPGLDDKVITSWNALMLKAYADAYTAFREPGFLEAALKNAAFLEQNLYKDGKLFRIWKNGKTSVGGFLEDYAFTAEAFIALYQATLNEHWLKQAHDLAELVLHDFYDESSGFCHFKSAQDEALIARKLDLADDVIPSGNSAFACVLHALGYYYEREDYLQKVRQMLDRLEARISAQPQGFSNWLQLLLHHLYGQYQLVATGAAALVRLEEVNRRYIPNKIDAGTLTGDTQLPLLAEKPAPEGKTLLYVCRDKTCGLPVETAEAALQQLIQRG